MSGFCVILPPPEYDQYGVLARLPYLRRLIRQFEPMLAGRRPLEPVPPGRSSFLPLPKPLLRCHSDKTNIHSENVLFFIVHVALSSLPNNCTKSIKVLQLKQCFGSGMFIPDLNFFHSGSRIRIKEFKYFKLSELKCDPDPDFYTSRIPAQNGTGSPIRNCVNKLLS
jgi:hypothetical protein